MHGCPGLADL